MRTRTVRWGLSAVVTVAAGLALTACGSGDNHDGRQATSTSATVSSGSGAANTSGHSTGGGSATHSRSATASAAPHKSPAGGAALPPGPSDPHQKCTDQYDYAGDSRSNAEINSIGSDTGTCPAIHK